MKIEEFVRVYKQAFIAHSQTESVKEKFPLLGVDFQKITKCLRNVSKGADSIEASDVEPLKNRFYEDLDKAEAKYTKWVNGGQKRSQEPEDYIMSESAAAAKKVFERVITEQFPQDKTKSESKRRVSLEFDPVDVSKSSDTITQKDFLKAFKEEYKALIPTEKKNEESHKNFTNEQQTVKRYLEESFSDSSISSSNVDSLKKKFFKALEKAVERFEKWRETNFNKKKKPEHFVVPAVAEGAKQAFTNVVSKKLSKPKTWDEEFNGMFKQAPLNVKKMPSTVVIDPEQQDPSGNSEPFITKQEFVDAFETCYESLLPKDLAERRVCSGNQIYVSNALSGILHAKISPRNIKGFKDAFFHALDEEVSAHEAWVKKGKKQEDRPKKSVPKEVASLAKKAFEKAEKEKMGELEKQARPSSKTLDQTTTGRQTSRKFSREELVKVWDETSACLELGYYRNSKRETQKLKFKEAVKGTEKFNDRLPALEDLRKYNTNTYKTEIAIVSCDCLQEAIYVAEELRYNPAVLNMANQDHPGGGYKKGSNAQEERLFRRTALAFVLDDTQNLKVQKGLYPLNQPHEAHTAGIYSPSVPIFRDTEQNDHRYLDKPVDVAFLTVAAVKDPKLKDKNGELCLNKEDEQLMTLKIYRALQMAADKGHDAVILGALGCGAFGNPPAHVARIFQKVIDEYFQGCFRYISFPIINDHTTGKAHNRQGNFKPFAETFGKQAVIIENPEERKALKQIKKESGKQEVDLEAKKPQLDPVSKVDSSSATTNNPPVELGEKQQKLFSLLEEMQKLIKTKNIN
ncbi:MAG: TIGR02452 family protein, partial [Anaerolineae bacterium]